jgi:hypothetical protein
MPFQSTDMHKEWRQNLVSYAAATAAFFMRSGHSPDVIQ